MGAKAKSHFLNTGQTTTTNSQVQALPFTPRATRREPVRLSESTSKTVASVGKGCYCAVTTLHHYKPLPDSQREMKAGARMYL